MQTLHRPFRKEEATHLSFEKFTDKGNFQNSLLENSIQVSFMPESTEGLLPKKFSITVESDKQPVSFRSDNPAILYDLIVQLSQIYFLFHDSDKRMRPDLFSFKIRKLQEDIKKRALNPIFL